MITWKGYEKGVNLGGWLSQCEHTESHYQNFIGKKDIEKLASWGIDHLRLPIDYELVETDSGEVREKGYEYIQNAIDWCQSCGLNLVLDLHKTAGYSFDQGESESGFFFEASYQKRFYHLWEKLARHFGKYQNMLAFELLNEVTKKEYSNIWNHIAHEAILRIRQIAPSIDILVGGYWNNSLEALCDLEYPLDEHIVYNFHCYSPLIFTHQGASWVENMPPDFQYSFQHTCQEYQVMTKKILPEQADGFERVIHSEQRMGEGYFAALLAPAIQVAKERNVRLYCGEYGVIDHAEPAEQLAWYQSIHSIFEQEGISRAAWTYRGMNFGLDDMTDQDIQKKLLQYL